MRFTNFFKRKKALSTLEITVVVVMLFVMFIVVIDMSLYFRQPYLIQSLNDELLTKIQLAHNCYNGEVNKFVIHDAIKKHYNKDIIVSCNNCIEADEEEDEIDYPTKKVYEYDASPFKIILSCKNPQVPDSILSEYQYNGIFLYKNKKLTSNPSTNTTETYY